MRWLLPPQKLSDDPLTQLLLQRGLKPEEFAGFLHPELSQIHSFSELYGAAEAAVKILDAIKAGKKIFIHGDYDVDGVCATAILWRFLYRELSADVLPRIPNRFDEGYGLSDATLNDIVSQGGQMVITVDCGIRDATKVRAFPMLEFVITDHHAIPEGEQLDFPEGVVVVHPRHPAGPSSFPDVCGANVAWKLCQAIAARAGLSTDMSAYLDLVALATVGDVMPLQDENRAIVTAGLARMREQPRAGIAALLQVAAVDPQDVKAYHMGFSLGPRLNAAGRLEDATRSLQLMSTDQPARARELAQQLNELNSERQQQTLELMRQAEAQIALQGLNAKLIFVHGDEWPEGIVGLVASRLTEKYHRPVLVGSHVDVNTLKGSGRSIPGFHLAQALTQADDLLTRYGGHAAAAGFTLPLSNLGEFTKRLQDYAAANIQDADLIPLLKVDVVVTAADVNLEMAQLFTQLEPCGYGNTTPVVAVMELDVAQRSVFGSGKQHLTLLLRDPVTDQFLEVKSFNGTDKWGAIKVGERVSVAGSVSVNEWGGRRSAQFILKDLLPLSESL